MMSVRHAESRGVTNLGWLESRHTFSFGHYYDPDHMGFGPLRVINDDRVRPGAGFDTHGHRDMEIISYVLDGAIEHKDSMGTGSVIRPGEVQVMSAGTGIRHSEFNSSQTEPVHFLQIWLLPDRQGLPPRYEQKSFSASDQRGKLRLVGSPSGRDGSIVIHQDAQIYDALLNKGDVVTRELQARRKSWIQVISGGIEVNGRAAGTGDGVAAHDEAQLNITSRADNSEFLLFDLP